MQMTARQKSFPRLTLLALVDILGTVDAAIAAGTGAREGAVYGTGVAHGVLVAGIRRASVVQVTKET